MKLSKKFLRKSMIQKTTAMLLTAGIMIITACSREDGGSSVSISNDGKVNSRIVENFDKSYYDQEELKQKILREADEYNLTAGEGAVSVEKVDVDEDVVKVEMTYATAADYAAFNDADFFVGSAAEAQDAGYNLNRVLISANNSLETIGMSDILGMTDAKILITDAKDPVVLNGKAEYTSNNVTMDEKLKTASFDEESKELAYIIFTN